MFRSLNSRSRQYALCYFETTRTSSAAAAAKLNFPATLSWWWLLEKAKKILNLYFGPSTHIIMHSTLKGPFSILDMETRMKGSPIKSHSFRGLLTVPLFLACCL